MKIINQIVIYDVYVVCADDEDEKVAAREAVMSLIRDPDPTALLASESNSLEVRHEREIRAAWLNERPIVSGGVSDADFEALKGKSTKEVFSMLHEKTVDVKATKKAAAK